MRDTLNDTINSQKSSQLGDYENIRRRRLMQICTATSIGVFASLLVARSVTVDIFAFALAGLAVALILAFKHKVQASAYVLLGSMAVMLFALALTGAGLFDLAILGFPGLLIFAAILGGIGVFLTLLFILIVQCIVIVWLNLTGIIVPHTPSASWAHLVFASVLLTVTGFSVFILVNDIKRLMRSLQRENEKVLESQIKIQHLAHHDSLTNLPNRLFGEQLFEQKLKQCDEKQRGLALFFIDLDNFKPVNDALGHAAGDQLLEQLTHRLSEQLNAEQTLIRFGGDEFLVLAPFEGDDQGLKTLAESLIEQCASVFNLQQTHVVVSASLGIARAPIDGREFKHVCRKADIAMYKAKQNGRNTYHFYDDSLDHASNARFNLLQLLRPALKQGQFELYYQPIVDLSNPEISTVEALLRWPQADGKMIPPDQFIPVAESSGLINQIGQWVIEQACEFCAQQRQQGNENLRVAVNISVVQFKDGNLQTIIESALAKTHLPASALELELTESVLIDDTNQIKTQLKRLNDLGLTIAIDDFGTGYSNLGYLREFQASTLKIDRSFIDAMTHSEQDKSLVRAIISMASSMGLKTVAEGIEEEHTLQQLMSMGCDFGQGYFWSKPISAEQFTALLNQNR